MIEGDLFASTFRPTRPLARMQSFQSCRGSRSLLQTSRRTASHGAKCKAMSTSTHVLVLPGFLSGSSAYKNLVESLHENGYSAEVLKIDKSEWYPSLLGFSFEWYINRLSAAIDHLFKKHGKLILVGHSAAGWIARLCLGKQPYMGLQCGQFAKVEKLITLGTPHLSLEAYPFGRFNEKIVCNSQELPSDVKTSSLKFANFFYGEASELDPVQIVCVVGNGIKGIELKFLDRMKYLISGGSVPYNIAQASFAYVSYKVNCLRGDTTGDGVCPVESSLLPGAEHLVLEGVYHGPNDLGLAWYGSKEVLSKWASFLI